MGEDHIVAILRHTMETALLLGAPLLIIATVVGLVINIAQVLTSLQDSTVSTVPRLFAVAAALLVLLPWMTRRLSVFAVQVLSDFHPFVR